MQKNLKAALYIRVSTEEQALDGQSASAQVETLKQYCLAYGIEVFNVYMDLGISGKSLKDRYELRRLMEDCFAGKFEIVLVWKISRLSRNLKDLLYLIDTFEKHNVHFASCSEKFDTSTPVGRMTLQLLGSIAEFERNTIVENVKLGLGEFARKGGKSSSVLGYDNADKKLIVNESEANIVKLIFRLHTEADMNYATIAQYLNSLGYRTKRGFEFRGSSISYIIHNPVYKGINRHKMNTEYEYDIRGMHPAIIDPELWTKAQSITPKSKRRVADSSSSDILALQVTCLKCNSPMKVFYSYSKGKRYKYLRCCRCSNYVNMEKLIKVVSEKIYAVIDDKTLQKKVFSLIRQTSACFGPEHIELTSLESDINRLRKNKARYLSLFEDCKISDSKTFTDRIAEIDFQLKMLEKKKHETTDYDEYFSVLKSKISSLEPAVLKQMSACLIKSIEAYRDEIRIVLYL